MADTLRQSDIHTYGEYLSCTGEHRLELIEGVVYDLSPAPSRRHQEICGELFRQIANFLTGKDCRVYAAPFDVRLPRFEERDEDTTTVVQPDISVVCDSAKLDDRGCRGTPDWVVEIISPATASRDQIQKVALYEAHGVQEYWIVHPTDNLLTIRRLDENGRYGIPEILEGRGEVRPAILPELGVDLDAVFKVSRT
ncbi:MAG: Uma2 family endonuclease [Thermodesulfobacteriota bacterium]